MTDEREKLEAARDAADRRYDLVRAVSRNITSDSIKALHEYTAACVAVYNYDARDETTNKDTA